MVSPYPGTRSYPPGFIIYVDPDRAVTNGCRVIAKLPESNEATFKIYSEDGGKRFLKPLNPQYPIIEMTDGMIVCGVVVGGMWEE
jgi:SOS-response transcriptional repressor LexA